MDKKLVKKFASYEKERIKKQMEREEFQARCDHKIDKKGRSVAQLKEGQNGEAICRICGAHLSFDPISQKSIAEAKRTFVSALQQFKILKDDVPGKVLDDIAFAIQVAERLENLYAPIRKELSMKNEGYVDDVVDQGNYYASSNYPLFSEMDKKKHKKNKDKKHKKNKGKHSIDYFYR